MEKTQDEVNARNKSLTITMLIVMVMLVLMLTGCASYTIRDSKGAILSQGEAIGFLRTITVVETYDKDGKIKSRKISTNSTTKDVLMGLDHFIDTAVNTASKLKP